MAQAVVCMGEVRVHNKHPLRLRLLFNETRHVYPSLRAAQRALLPASAGARPEVVTL